MPAILTRATAITCPHGGEVKLVKSANTAVSSADSLVLLETDVHMVERCTFMMGQVPSPCVKVAWSGGSADVAVGDDAVLVQSSVGLCKNVQGVAQGSAIIPPIPELVTAD